MNGPDAPGEEKEAVVLPALDPVLPAEVDTPELAAAGILLRAWRPEDVPALSATIAANLEHLRPWMPWIAFEPTALGERAGLVAGWERERLAGGGVVYGIWEITSAGERAIGGTGLHRRIAADGLEIGYWLAADAQGRGIVTGVVSALTRLALQQPGITHVEIHTDSANKRSGAVAIRCGYVLAERVQLGAQAPAESGETLIWRFPEDPDR